MTPPCFPTNATFVTIIIIIIMFNLPFSFIWCFNRHFISVLLRQLVVMGLVIAPLAELTV